jgi:hypothetical protein
VNFSGVDTLTFVASNGTDQSRPAVVTITVTPSPNDTTPPQVVWTYPGADGTLRGAPPKPTYSGPLGPVYGPPIVVQLSLLRWRLHSTP